LTAGLLSQNKGYARHTVSASVVRLSAVPAAGVVLPDGALAALIQCHTNPIMWSDDSVDPSATDGMIMSPNETIIYRGDLNKLRFTRSGGADGEVRLLYYSAETPEIIPDTGAGAGGGSGDGAIQDGASPSIEATVFDYVNANPLAVRLADTNGDYVAVGGGTQYAEDTAAAAAEILTMAGVVRQDAVATRVDATGDRTELIVDASGRLWVNVGTMAALPAGTNNIGDVDVLTLPSIPAGANAIGTVGVTSLPTLPAGVNNIGDVDVLTLPAIPAGTNNIGDVDVLTLPSLPVGNNNIGDVDIASAPTGASAIQNQGAAAHDAAVAGAPVLTGAYASLAAPTDISTDGDAVRLWADRAGRLATMNFDVSGVVVDPAASSGALVVKRAFANVAASSTDSNIVSSVATKKIRVLAINAVAGATATNLTFNTKPAGAGSAISPLYANGPNGGEILSYNPHGWFQTTAGEGLTVTTGSGSTTGVLVTYVEAV
jgi:hypothetical protein